MSQRPKIMISSTFYDLKQVRADLVNFLKEELGFEPLVSEASAFPVDPDLNTIDNCRKRVEVDADILILILGSRYGYVDPATGRSVTNLEYLSARAKGIPIFSFVERGLITLLPVYQKNRTANFEKTVEDTRVFEFLEQIREKDQVWCHEFELAADIISSLRQQLAYTFYDGLMVIRTLKSSSALERISGLVSGSAFRFVLEKPIGWEFRLFAAALADEIAARGILRRKHQLGITLGTFRHVQLGEVGAWLKERVGELGALVSTLSTIMNVDLQEAIGEPGESGNADLIAYSAHSLGNLYEEAIEWALRWRRTSCHELLTPVKDTAQGLVRDIIEKVEQLGPQTQRAIQEMDAAIARGEAPRAHIVLNLQLSGTDEVLDALAQATRAAERLGRD